MTCGIARIVCVPTGEGYVIGSLNCEELLERYQRQGRDGELGSVKIQARWNEYGPTAFRMDILEDCPREALNKRKQHYLDLPTGRELNRSRQRIVPANTPPSPEHQAKIAAAQRCPEVRAKKSAALKGKKLSQEHRAKISAALKGKKHSAETRAKISAAHRRRFIAAQQQPGTP